MDKNNLFSFLLKAASVIVLRVEECAATKRQKKKKTGDNKVTKKILRSVINTLTNTR